MKRFILIIIFSSILCCTLFSVAHCKDDTYHNSDGHFSFTIPQDWIEIPDNVVNEYVEWVRSQAPIAAKFQCDAAFQKISENYFDYPRMLVVIDNRRAYSLDEMKKILQSKTTGPKIGKALNVVEKELSEYGIKIESGEIIFVKDKNAFFYMQDASFQEEGNIKSVTVLMLGKYGFVKLMFYANESTYNIDKDALNKVIDSFAYDDGFEYH